MTLSRTHAGLGLAVAAAALLTTAVAGIAPWVLGTDADCPDQGPDGVFLLCWLASVGAAFGAVACLATTTGPTLARRAGIVLGGLVVISAAVWFVVVVGDGIQECGF
jgi:hypothetical protein